MSGPAHSRYDDVVVGAGTAGLTAALLLARSGRSVLLVDRAPAPGGALRRFRRSGAWFDTGFHFTGSVLPGELFDHLLDRLGVRGQVDLRPYRTRSAHRFVFTEERAEVEVPQGLEAARACWRERFPEEADAVDWYFDAIQSVAARTMGMIPGAPLATVGMLDEDFVSLRSVLDARFRNPLLKGAVSAFAMCHGSPPAKVSFAAHARVAYGFHQSVGYVTGGGDALARALSSAAAAAGVEICCGCGLEAFTRIEGGQPREAALTGGRTVVFERCVLTIAPAQILEFLQPIQPTPAFRERVKAFEPSIGFFAGFGIVGQQAPGDGHVIRSEFPETDFDRMMDPAYGGERPLVLIEVPGGETDDDPPTVSALEMSFAEDVARWAGSRKGCRPPDYVDYKRRRLEAIAERVGRLARYADGVRWVESASMLTFRDWLHSPEGSAYGIVQKVGQYGLFGRLPGRNVYAAGQSALLPGVLGAMMSGIFAARQMIGKDAFDGQLFGTEGY